MTIVRAIFAFSLMALATITSAAPIVDAAYVKDAISRGVIVWDVRATPQYKKGHLPGAVSIGDAGTALREMTKEDFIETEKIAKILGDAGIDPAQEVIVYGDRGSPQAYFGRFALRYFGGKNVSVFHDGADGWTAAGNTQETTDSVRPAIALKLTPVERVSATTDEVVALARRKRVQIIDARTPAEHYGEDVRAIRGGHIPNAMNIPFEQNWKDPETAKKLAQKKVPDNSGMALKTADELTALYAKLDPNKKTVVYCQSGMRAAETATVLEQLGFKNVRVYDSSWLGYAARLKAPVANETFFNVGVANGKVAAMQKRIDDLERAVEQLAAAQRVAAAAPAAVAAK
jgi:thiosulfate/3-mercaptopyruvate sulfurtransferase